MKKYIAPAFQMQEIVVSDLLADSLGMINEEGNGIQYSKKRHRYDVDDEWYDEDIDDENVTF